MSHAPRDPFELMRQLNSKGEAFWLDNLCLSDGRVFHDAAIVSVGPAWIQIKTDGHGSPGTLYWIQISHIINLTLTEG